MSDTVVPRARADARRNRERLLAAALRAFSTGRQPVTLEAVAREAGVGIGTLYRHFPTREALVEAAYRTELARLQSRAKELLDSQAPEVALRTWMDELADYVRVKHGMAETLRAIAATGAIASSTTREALLSAIGSLLEGGVGAGTVRADVRPDDVFASLTGIVLAAGGPEQRDQAKRLIDLLMAGLRRPA